MNPERFAFFGNPYNPGFSSYFIYWAKPSTIYNSFNQVRFSPVKLKEGTYFSFFNSNSRQDMKTIGVYVNRKVMLDGHVNAPQRPIGITVLNNGIVPANGYQVYVDRKQIQSPISA